MNLSRRAFATTGLAIAATTAVVPLAGCPSKETLQTAANDIPVITNIVKMIAAAALAATGNGMITPVVMAGIDVASRAASAALVLLQSEIDTYAKTKDASLIVKIDAAIETVKNNLTDLLSSFHVQNKDLIAYINGAIALALSVISSLQLLIPAPPTASTRRLAAPQALATPTVVVTPEQVKTLYNSLCVQNGQTPYQVK